MGKTGENRRNQEQAHIAWKEAQRYQSVRRERNQKYYEETGRRNQEERRRKRRRLRRKRRMYRFLMRAGFQLFFLLAVVFLMQKIIVSLKNVAGTDQPVNAERMVSEVEAAAVENKKIVIDPGHGGEDSPGTVFAGIQERDINLQIAELLEDKLTAAGYQVIMTRTSDVYVDLKERGETANREKALLFVSIHQNALEKDTVTKGMETWYHGQKNAKNRRLASCIQEETVRASGAENKGIKENQELAVLKTAEVPACLIETGFLSQAEEREKLCSPAYQEQLAEGIFKGIQRFLEENGGAQDADGVDML